jgi:hypothetical protein
MSALLKATFVLSWFKRSFQLTLQPTWHTFNTNVLSFCDAIQACVQSSNCMGKFIMLWRQLCRAFGVGMRVIMKDMIPKDFNREKYARNLTVQ